MPIIESTTTTFHVQCSAKGCEERSDNRMNKEHAIDVAKQTGFRQNGQGQWVCKNH